MDRVAVRLPRRGWQVIVPFPTLNRSSFYADSGKGANEIPCCD